MSSAPSGRRGIPRAVELVLAGVALILASPLMLIVALVVKLGSRGPILFTQDRVGRGGRAFRLRKFRSMTASAVGPKITAGGDPRITRAGRLLRAWKLDELPQLWNVLAGDMSIVGPRPEVPDLVDRADPRWQEVLAVRPGLTDPVTLLLRDEEQLLASVDDPDAFYRESLAPFKLEGYVEYVRHRSFGGDVRIVLRTIGAVFGRRRPGISAETIARSGTS